MLKDKNGNKVTPNQAAKNAIIEGIKRVIDTCPEGILSDDEYCAFGPKWCATDREAKQVFAQMRKRANSVFKYLGVTDPLDYIYHDDDDDDEDSIIARMTSS